MVYTNIQELRGLDQPVDYGSGIEYADSFIDPSTENSESFRGLQVGLWLNGSEGCQDIVDGKLTTNLERLYKYIVHSPFAQIFLRVGYEFDNPEFGYIDRPSLFVQAFQRVVEGCRSWEGCRTKTVFVWHSWAAGLPANQSLNEYYPGNDYVDWIGISLFQQFYPDSELGNLQTVQEVLDFASSLTLDEPAPNDNDNDNETNNIRDDQNITERDTKETHAHKDVHHHHSNDHTHQDHHHHHHSHHHKPTNNDNVVRPKPLMIAESTPYRGIDVLDDPWQDWFVPVLQLIDNYDIAMWSYINCDWTEQPLWQTAGFGNSRLALNATVLRLWNQHVLAHPRFQFPPTQQQDGMLATAKHGKQQKGISSLCDWVDAVGVNDTEDSPTPAVLTLSSTFFSWPAQNRHALQGGEMWRHLGHMSSGDQLLAYWFLFLLFGMCVGCCVFCCSSHGKIRSWHYDLSRRLSAIPEGRGNEEEDDGDDVDKDQMQTEQQPLMATKDKGYGT